MLHFMSLFVITLLVCVNSVYPYKNPFMRKKEEVPNHNGSLTPRILLGDTAKLGAYPWMAYITYEHVKDGKPFFCGGTIIHVKHVLTSGNCCNNGYPGSHVVRVGETDLDKNPDCELEVFGVPVTCSYRSYEYGVHRTFVHPEYKEGAFISNICIMRLKEEIFFRNYIYAINLPFDNGVNFIGYQFDRDYMYAMGWGYTNKASGRSHILRVKLLRVYNIIYCHTKWQLNASSIDHRIICAGSSKQGNVCEGDTGGPLVNVLDKAFVMGVAVGTVNCVPGGSDDAPGLFARVDYYKDWIKGIIY